MGEKWSLVLRRNRYCYGKIDIGVERDSIILLQLAIALYCCTGLVELCTIAERERDRKREREKEIERDRKR